MQQSNARSAIPKGTASSVTTAGIAASALLLISLKRVANLGATLLLNGNYVAIFGVAVPSHLYQ
ncbi:MAG: hypothetical protein V7K14_17705 [Nostoc sp.]|uniref:hypothetical protein n=1 Tax=Nostoc sp. TaxID=1180 RepID=UPI002FF6B24E